MAKDEIIIKLRVDDGELKISSANIDKHSKKIDKQTKSKKRGTQASNRFNKAEKGLYQTNLAGAKGFSKMNQTMGGSSGLVAAYATLAANVFAATAAFGALRRAAQFEQLKLGLTELGHQSGRTLSIMAEGLRDVTGGAISAEEAMRAAALGVSGGFGGEQLAGLAKIARGASITLGRSLPDAFDRLTRGAIKLEPEILDELGIMVRLDDAVENYAATIGKAGSALTQMERRQAFMNAILEQGESKFGEIAEAVEPDAYSRLGATFDDLTQSIFNFFNQDFFFGFFGLNQIVGVLADNTGMLFGVMMLFGSTIAGKMIPALSGGAQAAADQADKVSHLAASMHEAQAAQEEFLIKGLGKVSDQKKPYLDMIKGLEKSTNKTKDLAKLKRSVNAQITRQKGIVKGLSGVEKQQAIARLTALEAEKLSVAQLIALEAGKGAAAQAAAFADAKAASQKIASGIIIQRQQKEITFLSAWRALSAQTTLLGESLLGAAAAASKSGAELTGLAKTKVLLKAKIWGVRQQLRLMMGEMLFLLLPIAAIIIAVTALWAIWDWRNNTAEQKKYNKGVKQLDKLIEEMPKKVEKYNKALENTVNLADSQLRAFEISSGIITEMNDKLRAQIKLRKEADEGTGKKERLGKRGFRQWAETTGFGDVTGITGDALIEQFGLGKDFFDGLDEAKKAVQGVLSVEWSDELKVASAILKTGIPDQSKMLAMKLKDVFQSGLGPEEMVKAIQKAIGEVENAFGNLGPAAKGVRESLKEAEKEGSKFINTFAKKTSVDMFAKATGATVKSLNELEVTVKELLAIPGIDLDINVDETIGKSLLDVGAKMASIIGPEFVGAQRDLTQATRALNMAIKEGIEGDPLDALKKSTTEAAQKLGTFKKDVIKLNDAILRTQRLELTRKQTLVGINKVIKFASKNYKLNAKLAGIDAQMTLKKLKYEQQITKSKIEQVRTMFKEISYMEAATEVGKKDTEETMKLEDFLLMTLEEQQILIEKSNLTQENLFSLLGSITEEKLQQLDIDKESESIGFNTALQAAEALKVQLGLVKKIRDLEDQGLKLVAKKNAFLMRGTTDLNAAEEATLKINAAQRALDMAKTMARVEFAIIDAKTSLQLKEAEFLNKQIEVVNAQAKMMDPKAKDVEIISFAEQEKSIQQNALLQKLAISQNLDNLQLGLEVALYEGLESFIEAVKSDDINLLEGTKGANKIFDSLKGLENQNLDVKIDKTNEILAAMLTLWEESKESPSFGVTVVDDKTSLTKAEQREVKVLAKQAARETERLRKVADRAAKDANQVADRAVKTAYPAEEESGWEWLKNLLTKPATDESKTLEGGSLIDIMHAESEAFVTALNTLNTTLTTETGAIGNGGGGNGGAVDAAKPTGTNVGSVLGEMDDATPDPDKDPVPDEKKILTYTEALNKARLAQAEFTKEAMKWGPEGEAYAAMMEGFLGEQGLVVSIKKFTESTGGMMETLALAGDVISAMGGIMASSSKMMVAQIDNQIAAEKAKDGSSKESMGRIKAMEAKKLAIQKKAFETKKKIAIATTMINVVTAVVQAWVDYKWPWGAVLGAVIAAMGMKQVAMIKSQQFTGGSGEAAVETPTISVGKRSNKVDVSQQASSGELAYLRGEKGVGTTANKFTAMGGASGLRKGYATGGEVLVGERGPETITPLTGLNVFPGTMGAKSQINASFTIHALDAAGVEEVLLGQQGNIINMIRSAANEHGEDFLEVIDTDTYGDFSSGGGVDY